MVFYNSTTGRHLLKFSSFKFPPHVTYEGDTLLNDAIMGKVFYSAVERFNIDFIIKIHDDLDWGREEDDGSWTGLMGDLQRNESDIAFCLFFPSTGRNTVAKPSTSFWQENLMIMAGRSVIQQNNMFGFISVFSWQLWCCIGLSMLIMALVSAIPVPATLSQKRFTFINYLGQVLYKTYRYGGNMVMEADPDKNKSNHEKILLGIWWLSVLLLSNVFTGVMKASLLVISQGNRIKTAHDLAERSWTKVYMVKGPAYPLILAYSDNDDYQSIYRMLVEYDDTILPPEELFVPRVMEEIVTEKAVIIADQSSLTYQMGKFCSAYPNSEMYFAEQRLFSHPMVMYYNQKLSQNWSHAYDELLARLLESGLQYKWYENTFGTLEHCPTSKTSDLMTFEDFLSTFVFLGIGAALSGASLIVECIYARSTHSYQKIRARLHRRRR